jgi:5-oxopent-3-ene-1,2,5-tricarboxylate decarboxylase/2-hydroxyhepta-2,4-diene-1,7-dioate isomerase
VRRRSGGPHYVIADLARHITLLAGDVILMGTPCHSRSVDAGDVVECEISGLGCVSGTVVAIEAPRASALGVGHAPTDSTEVRRVALGFDERVPQWLQDNLRRAKSRGIDMKVCIVGAGAIGGFIGTRLAASG